ncbi:6-phosphogluconolactonase [uncultured Methylobacterium sp.]|jgi:6-phosphogluconolactonase|uniref:6-phosphogluconolactonase n=1 Tax=uncultured Methylobacterium sp. TaxID=157278 RepID=UPI002621D7FC|nr:6-phosphogluconolactonase [uncultured Methylobacterium sp.]
MAVLPPGAAVLPDPDAVARAAADHIVAAAQASDRVALCLSGGSTPRRLYALLAGEYRDRVPWERLHLFFGDERVGDTPEAGSNARMVAEAFGSDSPVPPGHLFPIPIDGTPEDCAGAYEATLRGVYGAGTLTPERPLFDLVLLGLGEDGHTASLFPGKPAVEEDSAWVVGVPEAGLAPFVPRVSLTLPALAATRRMLFLVTGAGKVEPLARLAAGENLPAGRARAWGETVWLLDEAAAG